MQTFTALASIWRCSLFYEQFVLVFSEDTDVYSDEDGAGELQHSVYKWSSTLRKPIQ